MIAVTGASGQLGSAFLRFLGSDAHGLSRTELDITDHEAVRAWLETHRPELVLNCAAYTQVDAAEADPAKARAVNVEAVATLADATALIGARFVTFSTDYVFDGEKGFPYVESDPPNPLNIYGRTKLEGERLALDANPSALVIRTAWLVSATHSNFLTTIVSHLAQGEPVRAVVDHRGSPTWTDDLVRATLAAVDSRLESIIHLVNEDTMSWYEVALLVADAAGFDPELVRPITRQELGRPALRPAFSGLSSERTSPVGPTDIGAWCSSVMASAEDRIQ